MATVDTAPTRAKLAAKAAAPAQSTALAPKRDVVSDLLSRLRPAIEQARPRHIDPDRLTRVLLTAVRTSPELQKAAMESERSQNSLKAAVVLTAQLGLECGPLGQAYLVPFRREGHVEAQLIIGYRGMLELARRSGQIQSVMVEPVHENDTFDYELGLTPRLVHKPALKDRGKVILYYGIVRFKDGGYQMAVMSLEDIEKHRARSKAKDSGPWKEFYDEMCRKTVLRSMWRWLPVSVEMATAEAADETTGRDVPERGYVSVSPGYAEPDSDQVVTLPAEAVRVGEPEPAPAQESSPQPTGGQEALL